MYSLTSSLVMNLILFLMAMAFFTLFERKFLGYAQFRKGPNKVSLMGILQPVSDAMKLLAKEMTEATPSNKFSFESASMINLYFAFMLLILVPIIPYTSSFKFGIAYFLCVSSVNVYTTLAAGWASNAKYSLLGATRSAAQTISYEVSMALILITILLFMWTLDTRQMYSHNMVSMYLVCPILFLFWMMTLMAETNRAPFDLMEGESELVSGFNTEYSGVLFTMMFMAEYLNIIIMSALTTIIFTGSFSCPTINTFMFTVKVALFSMFFVWSRSAFPRLRYDFLMYLTWKVFLPITLVMFTITLAIS